MTLYKTREPTVLVRYVGRHKGGVIVPSINPDKLVERGGTLEVPQHTAAHLVDQGEWALVSDPPADEEETTK
jgi:hypothetical protein